MTTKGVEGNAQHDAAVRKELDDAFEPLRQLTPDLGAYINEAAGFEKNPAKTFWGGNYEKLLAIKRAVDPQDVFWCNPCVGNERWEAKADGRLCKIGGSGKDGLDARVDTELDL